MQKFDPEFTPAVSINKHILVTQSMSLESTLTSLHHSKEVKKCDEYNEPNQPDQPDSGDLNKSKSFSFSQSMDMMSVKSDSHSEHSNITVDVTDSTKYEITHLQSTHDSQQMMLHLSTKNCSTDAQNMNSPGSGYVKLHKDQQIRNCGAPDKKGYEVFEDMNVSNTPYVTYEEVQLQGTHDDKTNREHQSLYQKGAEVFDLEHDHLEWELGSNTPFVTREEVLGSHDDRRVHQSLYQKGAEVFELNNDLLEREPPTNGVNNNNTPYVTHEEVHDSHGDQKGHQSPYRKALGHELNHDHLELESNTPYVAPEDTQGSHSGYYQRGHQRCHSWKEITHSLHVIPVDIDAESTSSIYHI